MFSKLRTRSALHHLAIVALLTATMGARAETVEVPVGQQDQLGEITELRGLKKDAVTTRLGDPLGIQGPVGDPAISRWEYPDFYVYFEWDIVLHTVKKHRG
ncbi:hypothetical protein [Microbulbifer sp.]|uniref:hypothetical protein n=1 Tax=Microbulbifer sp. TaxID=1908541 RepID=UPI003F3A9C3A